ncbi:hypothetical protein MTBBW1_2200048 [Desulfamplus magnetovallimortis]|uniref:Uncharacterized protein n=1 Tax=Desulfamplus magnetovallimortis TaxID=1246637 RepID=A0A1W1HD23_9BACT|nr:hypothetical protein MTBBW1_2200048 [Desulfamplus magnetovallimortis]
MNGNKQLTNTSIIKFKNLKFFMGNPHINNLIISKYWSLPAQFSIYQKY